MTTNKTEKKPTKRDHFNALLDIPAVADNEALTAFINHELELLDRKNSGEKKPTKAQQENIALKEDILACMEDGRLYTISEMIKEFPCCVGLTAPKVTAIFTRLLVPEGSVVNTKDKRKSYYSKA